MFLGLQVLTLKGEIIFENQAVSSIASPHDFVGRLPLSLIMLPKVFLFKLGGTRAITGRVIN